MSQKSSFPQAAKSVSQVLMSDILEYDVDTQLIARRSDQSAISPTSVALRGVCAFCKLVAGCIMADLRFLYRPFGDLIVCSTVLRTVGWQERQLHS